MKKLIVLLLVLSFIMPSTAMAAGTQTPPPPSEPPAMLTAVLGLETPPLDTAQLDKALAWSASLSKEQRVQLGKLLESVAFPSFDAKTTKFEDTQAAFSAYQAQVEAGLEKILSADQMEQFKESVKPLDVNAPAAVNAQSDCYSAYTYNNTAYGYAYYFYYYANLANAATTDYYSPITLNMAYNTWLYTYQGRQYSYNAWLSYPNYVQTAYNYTAHAYYFSYYGWAYAYNLLVWVNNTNTSTAYTNAYNTWYYMPTAESYARKCKGSAQDTLAPNHSFLPFARTTGTSAFAQVPAFTPPTDTGALAAEMVLASPDASQKALLGTELARSLTADQRKAIADVLKSTSNVDKASAGIQGVLSAEQLGLYQDSLLPAPDVKAPQAPETQNDCYYAYYYYYYSYVAAYQYYLYAYNAYLGSSDAFMYPNYLNAYWAYYAIYQSYVATYNAYASYTATNRYNAYYYSEHALGLNYYGYNFAAVVNYWIPGSNSYNTYAYAYQALTNTYKAAPYARVCYTGP